jgi:pimeloyl-ACP methyl ester carboxylesterase
MDLFYRKLGPDSGLAASSTEINRNGVPVIIMHGLYGSSDNWLTIGRELSADREVYLLDLRNHGNSPHSDRHTYPLMKLDLLEFIERHEIEKPDIIGHSIGGKVAMAFAAGFPERIRSMAIVDIGPKSYHSLTGYSPQAIDHMNILNAMQSVDFSKIGTREEIDARLAEYIKSERIRNFLMKSIRRDKENSFSWKINVPVLVKDLPAMLEGVGYTAGGVTGFPILFIRGENSDYISDDDIPGIKNLFPAAEFVTIPGAGHWLHAEKPELVVKALQDFLNRK